MVILRKGKSLYTGRVDNMIASHGFFVLQAENMEALEAELKSNDAFNSIKKEGESFVAYLKEPMSASEFNKEMHTKGISLSHLVKRKESLEEQFLEITKNLN